jgi:5-deoxy-glucuronate isomerase
MLRGRASASVAGIDARLSRRSLFEEPPSAIHAAPGDEAVIRSEIASEWLAVGARNPRAFASRIYREGDCAREDRGAELAQGACRRLVRTLFDYSTRPESELVVGEVVNFPGRWSTYPPHHHPQAEIYHYRFTRPEGYGHGEIGDAVYKLRNRDTLLIPGGLDHSQVSAPGFGMYYFWVIRHLPRLPYRGFTFTPAYRWLLDPKNQGWTPKP